MSKLQIVRKCFSCGAVLQCDDPSKEGFITSDVFQSSTHRVLLCNKCYKSENLEHIPLQIELSNDLLTMLKDAKATDALIVYVVDVFSFESTFINEVNELIGELNILVIANKVDLLPKSVKEEEIKEYVAHRLRVSRLNASKIILCSSKNSVNLHEILNTINEMRMGHDVYIVGSKYAGKSALLTSLLSVFENKTSNLIVTDVYPNTKTAVMHIPLDRSSCIYDTPGLPNVASMRELVEKDVAKVITPTKMIERRDFTLYPKQSLVLGGLARIDLLSEKKVELKIFTNSKVEIKRITSYTPDKVFANWLAKKDVYPISEKFSTLNLFSAIEISIEESGIRDLGISGFGWISFNGDNQKFRISIPKGVDTYYTRGKVKC